MKPLNIVISIHFVLKVKLGLVEVWETHGARLDFVIKADDDTFLVMDNLMAQLQGRDPERPFMMGHKMTNEVTF